MNASIEISTLNIPRILKLFREATKSLVKIEACACKDFGTIKQILNELERLDIKQILSESSSKKLSTIFSDLQYVDALQQRLAHVVSTTDILRDELQSFTESTDSISTAFDPIVRLNLKQFQDTISLYLETTDAVHNAIREVSKNHKMLFVHISAINSPYSFNSEILQEANKVQTIYIDGLFQFQHPVNPLAINCVPHIKDIANLYTMEQERIILDQFLRTEAGYSNGYDIDSDKEQISLF